MKQRSSKPTASAGKAAFVEIPPNAARTMSALREMGYDSFASIMDLIDNSIDAGAKVVNVNIRELSRGSGIDIIDIIDDGKGMDEKTLAEALKLGSKVDHLDPHKRLGKYGMGLVTASISMAKNLWVLSRSKNKPAYEATFDLDTIQRHNKFVITLKPAESKRVVEFLGMDGTGTLVRLSQIDRINDTNVSRFAGSLRTKLGQTYRHFLAQGVNIIVNKRRVQRYDPLMLDHPETEVVLDQSIDLGDGHKATLKVVELPELGQSGDAEANIFPHNSGFYVVRNGREIIAGETFGFYRHHHSYSHFRAELAYHGESAVFHEDIKKSSIHPDDRLKARLNKLTKSLIEQSGRRGRERGEEREVRMVTPAAEQELNAKLALVMDDGGPVGGKKGSGDKPAAPEVTKPLLRIIGVAGDKTGPFFHAEHKEGTLIVALNTRHPLVKMVTDQKQPQARNLLNWIATSLAKAEMEAKGDAAKLLSRAGEYLAVFAGERITRPTKEES